MRKLTSTVAAAITLVALGAFTAVALRPANRASQAAAPVEVRTQVIRRTIRIVRHEKPKQPRPSQAVAGAAPPRRGTVAVAAVPRTATSGSGGGAPVHSSVTAAPVSTRTSGSAGGGAPAASPVRSSAPVRTRTSGSGGSGSSGSRPSGTNGAKPVKTRTSGGSGKGEHGDRGDGGGD